MGAAFLLAAKDLRQRFRDRSFLIVGVIAPLALAGIFTLVLAPVTGDTFRPRIAFVDADGSFVSRGLGTALAELDADGTLELAEVDGLEAAGRELEAGRLGATIHVPAGFGDAVTSGRDARLEVRVAADAPTTGTIARAIAAEYADRVRATVLAAEVLADQGVPSLLRTALSTSAASLPSPFAIGVDEARDRALDAGTYYAAAMAVFFVFFTVQVGVASFLDEERDGTMARLRAAPIGTGAILGGKGLASVALGVTSMAVLALATSVALGAEWGPPLGAAALIVAAVLAATGIMALVAGVVATPEAAGNLQSIVAVVLGALGGSFFQIPLGDGALSLLARLTPHHWFLRGLGDLSSGGGVAEVLPAVTAMLAFAVVPGALGAWALSRRLAR